MAIFRTLIGKIALAAGIAGLIWYIGLWLSNRDVFDPYYFRVIMLVGVAIILAVSLNIVNGVTGQFSIGHAGFMAFGAYAGAALTVFGQHRIFPRMDLAPLWQQHAALVAAMLVGGLCAAAAGFLIGLPSLRLRGDYLAIVTLGFGEIIRVAILNIDVVGGSAGFSGYQSEQHGRVLIPQLTNFFWVYVTVALVVMFSRNLLRSTPGLTFFSIREDEIAAEAMGVPTTRIKVTAFVVSAFFAGVAGVLYAHYDTYLKPESFNFLRSIEIVTMVVLGGMGSITGAVFGAAVLTAAPEVLRTVLGHFPQVGRIISVDLLRQLLYALLLIVLMLTRPQGVFGAREVSLRGLFQRRRRDIGAPLVKS